MTNIPTGPDAAEPENPSKEFTGVFKSGDVAVQRLKPGATSAVSDIAVERASEELFQKSDLIPQATVSPPAAPIVDEGAAAVASAAETLETLEETVAKVDALVQSVEQRQSQIEDAHNKAEAMLAEVSRIAEALTFSNALRDRINATVARTKRLRGNDGNPRG